MEKMEHDAPFIFYPLHVEPEASLQTAAQHAPNQTTVIDWLAKAVPAGWQVVVKEHPGQTSLRRRGFWQQIKRYPNVFVASTLEPAETIVTKARAVAVINSTVGLQAAFICKPVITFHEHYIGRLMGHVLYADSFDSTVSALRGILRDEQPTIAERRASKRAFDSAFAAYEFPVSDPNLLAGGPNKEPLDQREWETMVEKLIKTIVDARNKASLNRVVP
jgi:hypothetical protein